jgi:gamma-glutamyltranspeptidase/glutathione hydrolase
MLILHQYYTNQLQYMNKTFVILLFCHSLFLHSFSQDRITGALFSTRSEVIARNGMAATSHPLATQVAIDMLKSGGTAVDAAIAANAMLGLVEPTGCGIGGDLFAIVWDAKTQKLYGLNASGRSPKLLSMQYFIDHHITKIPSHGPLSVSVPGCVDGWFELHKKFGRKPMEDLLKPVIHYAREGFPVTELIAYYMERNARILKDYPGFEKTFMPGGHTPGKGEVFRNPDLAATLVNIASLGRDVFYEGKLAEIIAETVKKQGGFLSVEDLSAHVSEWVEPLSVNYRGYDIWELPPNGQGIAALQMLNILEGFDLSSMGFGSADYLHLFIESKKLVFEDRAKFYADPDFATIPLNQLLSKEYAMQRRQLIDMQRASSVFDAGNVLPPSTVYLTTADGEGNMVSLIQSNYRGMGSGIIPEGLGFVLQDRGELFALEPGHANAFAPGKRPFHTIIPGFITKDGKPWISFGVMGGDMQPQGHVQIINNLIDFGMNLQEAGDAPRIRHEGSSEPTGEGRQGSGTVFVESGIPYETVRSLLQLGHSVSYGLDGFGGYQAIMWDEENKVFYGASESRKDGQAAGY